MKKINSKMYGLNPMNALRKNKKIYLEYHIDIDIYGIKHSMPNLIIFVNNQIAHIFECYEDMLRMNSVNRSNKIHFKNKKNIDKISQILKNTPIRWE